LVIVKKLLVLYSPNEQLKEVICDILKKPYWIHLYPELYHQLSGKLIYVSHYFSNYKIKYFITKLKFVSYIEGGIIGNSNY